METSPKLCIDARAPPARRLQDYNASNGTYSNSTQAVQTFAQQTPFPVSCFTACPELALVNSSFKAIYDELSDASPTRTTEYLEAFATFGEHVSALFCQHRDLAACIASNPAALTGETWVRVFFVRRLAIHLGTVELVHCLAVRSPRVPEAARKPPAVVKTMQIRRAVQSRLLQTAGYGGYGTTGGYGGYSGSGTTVASLNFVVDFGGYGGYTGTANVASLTFSHYF
ncbi:hypothetical protein AK812_SmicGene34813 [Symbiodinium microadriaticum]|uniref:Uncharacterized protein n=1 Tax=Symbiodinium microadriaticum TaxID=2951 RepID=A0A1Q9CN27_SYMMI|nr:hypothetical protein AK812_SmicGene34813 [Symbiodinium microadriaticum]